MSKKTKKDIDSAKILEELIKNQTEQQVSQYIPCPGCGRCPVCGRRDTMPYNPYYPYWQVYPTISWTSTSTRPMWY